MSENTEDTLGALERAWMDAWIAGDRETCARILADDFVLTSARGMLMTKDQWLDAIASIVGESFRWEEIRVRLFGDVAVVHSRTTQRASVAGQDWSGRFLLTDVWVRRGETWQVVSRHGTGPLPEA